VIYPEADLDAVERFRAHWDPLSGVVAAHVTIAFPFEWRSGAEALQAVLGDVAPMPFRVRLGAPTVWDDEYLFLLAEEGGGDIARLHDAVHRAAGVGRPERFVPHMTIGRRPPGAEQHRMLRAAHGLVVSGWVRALSVYRREPDGRRVEEFTLPFLPT
jgi:2'-5' RNA ligase